MLDLLQCIQKNNYALLKVLREKDDLELLLLQHPDVRSVVCRIYSHPVPAYEALVGHTEPGLPQVYAYTEEEGCFVVEEEWIDGMPLSALLQKQRLTEKQALNLFRDICQALWTLHDLGIVHRDVKAENILVTADGHGKLLDLDASSRLQSGKQADTRLLGTVGYAAPEQFGFARSDRRTDIFSLGILLNIMLTGEHPSVHLAEGRLRPIISRCIEVNADLRYGSVAALLEELDAAPQTKRKPRLWPLLTAAVLALCLLWFLPKNVPETTEEPPAPPAVTEPEPEPEPEPPLEEPPAAEEIPEPVVEEEPARELLPIDVYPGTPVLNPTFFQYDLNGDGVSESYAFGVAADIFDPPMYLSSDQFSLDGSYACERRVAPSVWKEETPGQWVQEEAFAPLLEDAAIRVYRTEGAVGTAEAIALKEPLNVWPCGISVTYTPGCIGTWVYEATAKLGDLELKNLAVTTIISDSSDH